MELCIMNIVSSETLVNDCETLVFERQWNITISVLSDSSCITHLIDIIEGVKGSGTKVYKIPNTRNSVKSKPPAINLASEGIYTEEREGVWNLSRI